MSDDIQIKADQELKEALFKLFDMADLEPLTAEINGRDILLALKEIQEKIDQAASFQPPQAAPNLGGGGGMSPSDPPGGGIAPGIGGGGGDPFSSMAAALGNPPAVPQKELASDRTILIVGELGIITYQLKLALTKHGSKVTIVKGIDEAINEFKRTDYTDVLIDLYMPTEREGLLVLMEIKRLAREKGLHCNLVVIATPIKEKRVDLKEICKQRGATRYMQKTEGWHQNVINFFTGQEGASG